MYIHYIFLSTFLLPPSQCHQHDKLPLTYLWHPHDKFLAGSSPLPANPSRQVFRGPHVCNILFLIGNPRRSPLLRLYTRRCSGCINQISTSDLPPLSSDKFPAGCLSATRYIMDALLCRVWSTLIVYQHCLILLRCWSRTSNQNQNKPTWPTPSTLTCRFRFQNQLPANTIRIFVQPL